MFWPRKTRNVETDRFISHQSIHQGVCLDHDMRSHCIKTIDQATELQRAHLLSERRRAAYICKQHRNDHFRTARMLEFFTGLAEAGIVFGLIPAQQMHDESAPAFEGRRAQFAAWIGGEQSLKMINVTAD